MSDSLHNFIRDKWVSWFMDTVSGKRNQHLDNALSRHEKLMNHLEEKYGPAAGWTDATRVAQIEYVNLHAAEVEAILSNQTEVEL